MIKLLGRGSIVPKPRSKARRVKKNRKYCKKKKTLKRAANQNRRKNLKSLAANKIALGNELLALSQQSQTKAKHYEPRLCKAVKITSVLALLLLIQLAVPQTSQHRAGNTNFQTLLQH